ncbi:hypothetical protein EI555_011659, partial [Monodon monoceros]
DCIYLASPMMLLELILMMSDFTSHYLQINKDSLGSGVQQITILMLNWQNPFISFHFAKPHEVCVLILPMVSIQTQSDKVTQIMVKDSDVKPLSFALYANDKLDVCMKANILDCKDMLNFPICLDPTGLKGPLKENLSAQQSNERDHHILKWKTSHASACYIKKKDSGCFAGRGEAAIRKKFLDLLVHSNEGHIRQLGGTSKVEPHQVIKKELGPLYTLLILILPDLEKGSIAKDHASDSKQAEESREKAPSNLSGHTEELDISGVASGANKENWIKDARSYLIVAPVEKYQDQQVEQQPHSTLCLNMTARDMQYKGKKRLPWILAKSFMAACPVSMFMSKEKIPSPHSLKLRLKVNEGDITLTRMPKRIGHIKENYEIQVGIYGVISMRFNVEMSEYRVYTKHPNFLTSFWRERSKREQANVI